MSVTKEGNLTKVTSGFAFTESSFREDSEQNKFVLLESYRDLLACVQQNLVLTMTNKICNSSVFMGFYMHVATERFRPRLPIEKR